MARTAASTAAPSSLPTGRPPAAAPKGPGEPTEKKKDGDNLGAELTGIFLALFATFFLASLGSYVPADMAAIREGRGSEAVSNLIGSAGVYMADMLLYLFGIGAWVVSGLVLALSIACFRQKVRVPTFRLALSGASLVMSGLVLTHLVAQKVGWMPYGKPAAGILPGAVAVVSKAMLSTVGTAVLASAVFLASLAILSKRDLTSMFVRWVSRKTAPVVDKSVEVAAEAGIAAANQVGDASVRAASRGIDLVRDGMGRLRGKRVEAGETATADEVMDAFFASDRPIPTPHQTQHADAKQAELAEIQRLFAEQVPSGSQSQRDPLSTAAQIDAMPETAVRVRPQPEQMGDGEPRPAAQPESAERTAVRARPLPAPQADAGDDGALPRSARPTNATSRMRAEDVRQAQRDLAAMLDGDVPELDPAFVTPLVAASGEVSEPELRAATAPALPALAPVVPRAEPAAANPPGLDELAAQTAPGSKQIRIVETEALKNSAPSQPIEAVQGALAIDGKAWVLPPSSLLTEPPVRQLHLDEAANRILRENSTTLEQKLADFGVLGEVTEIRPGPVVTTYEFKPATGVKISRIVNLRDDLTMSLAALRVRVVAPIPGRDVVGIEVPNRDRQMVYFRDVLEQKEFREKGGPLTLILGKDIEGKPAYLDLAKAPHLLVAGATGTGKSVGINSFIASILYRATPDEVKFILIDPKILELSIYADIPHLLLPVLDEPRKAELALKWACVEMDRRYKMMADVNVRNLAGYKAKLPELRQEALRRRAQNEVPDWEGQLGETVEMPEDPPYIVVVIDEFADLIMAAGKEVEMPVARLAQKARAAGIHVILATQRPSTDVITGMIKANFPTRVSFQVASSIDSKVVLTQVGAESLLGKGDMLVIPPGEGHLRRCHGTWISDDEVGALAQHWRAQGKPKFEMDILKDPEAEGGSADDDGEADSLYDDAVQLCIEANQASVSFLQRKLAIGYGRAAKIVDTMERRGIVGPSRGPNKPREILVNRL